MYASIQIYAYIYVQPTTPSKCSRSWHLRSLSPIDDDTVLDSVRRTGRAVVVHEAARTLGMGAELAARIQSECFYELQAPVLRVTGYDLPYPPSRTEHSYLPDLDRVLDAVDQSLAH